MKKLACRISIFLNVLFTILFLLLCIYKRESIYSKLVDLSSRHPTEKELLAYNNNSHSFYEEDFIANEDFPIKEILFLGNSITMHGISEGLWDYRSGMAASAIQKDYVHILCKELSQRYNINLRIKIFSIANYERNFVAYDEDYFAFLSAYSPDMVILQIGENISSENLKKNTSLFINRCSDLMNSFSTSQKIVTLPFWGDFYKNEVLTEVALNSKSCIVDLSHLGSGLDKRCFAFTERKYKDKGVGKHPGDFGMLQIAKCIFSVINLE